MKYWYSWAIAASMAASIVTPSVAADSNANARSVFTVNVSKVKPGKLDAARRYYEQAWLPARREALRRGDIRSFRLLASKREDAAQPEFVLITEYDAGESYEAREAHFAAIFASLGRSGPITVDGLSRADIFESLAGLEDYEQVETARR